MFEIGRTFGIVQYDKEAPLKTMARDLCKVVGGMSMRSAPTGHSQSQGSVGKLGMPNGLSMANCEHCCLKWRFPLE